MRNPTVLLKHKEVTKQGLVAYARRTPYSRVGLKIAALLLIKEGQRPGWVSEVLGISRQSLNLWVHGVNKDGLRALAMKPRSGRPGQLTAQLRAILERDLEKSPTEVGLNRVRWDGPTLVVYLKRRFDLSIKVRQAQYWMHHIGFRLKRAGYSYLQAKGSAGQRFLSRLKKTSHPETP